MTKTEEAFERLKKEAETCPHARLRLVQWVEMQNNAAMDEWDRLYSEEPEQPPPPEHDFEEGKES